MRKGFLGTNLVIAITLVFLVVAVVVSITKPLDLAKEQQDKRKTSDAQLVLKAISSYFIANGRLPWANSLKNADLSPALTWKSLKSYEIGICEDTNCTIPGVLIKALYLPGNFLTGDSLLGKNGEIYIGKGPSNKSSIFACFVPNSPALRRKTGELYKINLTQPLPATGTLNTCSNTVSWNDDDVCYVCLKN